MSNQFNGSADLTPALAKLGIELDDLDTYVDRVCEDLRQVRAQRDDLLSALKSAADVMEAFEIGVDQDIRAAIAKAESR